MSSQSSGSEQEKSHEQFIEAVKKHEVIYRPDHEYYRDKNKRQIAWEQVVAECGMTSTVDDAKNRWKYLRDSFTDSHKKQIRQNWRYRKQMEFLLPYVGLRKRRAGQNNDVVDLTADEPDSLNQNDCSQFVEAALEDEHQNALNGNTVINQKQSKECELYTQTEIVTQKDDHQKAVNEKTIKNSKTSKDNELYQFFMVMYKEVLQFPDRKKVDVKRRIFDVVTEEELNTTRSLLKENGFRKCSLDVTSNNLPVTKKPRAEESNNSTSFLKKRSSLNANTSIISKHSLPHSKNTESYISSNSFLPKANNSATNFSNAFSNELNSLPKPSTSTISPINVSSNHLLTEHSKTKGNDLNYLSKPSTSAVNHMLLQPKNKEIKLNVTSHSPIVSITSKSSNKTTTFPNQLHNELLRKGSQVIMMYPKMCTKSSPSISSNQLQTEQSLPKIKSATTISIDAFSQELETEQSKSTKSGLPPIPLPHLSPIRTTSISTTHIPIPPILNNSYAGTSFVISNVTHIGQSRDNGFQVNLTTPQASYSTSKNDDAFSNKLQSTETSQNNEVEVSFKNSSPTEVSSTTTIKNSTSIISNDKIVGKQNIKEELNPANKDKKNAIVMQEEILSTNFVDTLDKMDIEYTDKKDEDVLSLSEASCTAVDQIVLSDENE